MKEKRLQIINVVLFVIFFIAGIILVLYNKKTVDSGADNIVRQYGDSMNTETYIFYFKESLITLRELGIALTIIGSIGGIVSFVKLQKR